MWTHKWATLNIFFLRKNVLLTEPYLRTKMSLFVFHTRLSSSSALYKVSIKPTDSSQHNVISLLVYPFSCPCSLCVTNRLKLKTESFPSASTNPLHTSHHKNTFKKNNPSNSWNVMRAIKCTNLKKNWLSFHETPKKPTVTIATRYFPFHSSITLTRPDHHCRVATKTLFFIHLIKISYFTASQQSCMIKTHKTTVSKNLNFLNSNPAK